MFIHINAECFNAHYCQGVYTEMNVDKQREQQGVDQGKVGSQGLGQDLSIRYNSIKWKRRENNPRFHRCSKNAKRTLNVVMILSYYLVEWLIKR